MYSNILVGLDGSAMSGLALEHAADLAHQVNATITLLHVVEDMPDTDGLGHVRLATTDGSCLCLSAASSLLDEAATALRQEGIAVNTILRESGGRPVPAVIAQEVLRLGCDFVVLGANGRRGFDRRRLGSDAEQAARIVPVTVMLVRQAQTAVSQDMPDGSPPRT